VDTEGVGDIALVGRFWTLKPEPDREFNVQLGRHGDAAFADWIFIVTYSRKF